MGTLWVSLAFAGTRLSFKHNAFYYRHRDGRWERMGTDVRAAKERAAIYNSPTDNYGTTAYWLEQFLVDCQQRVANMVEAGQDAMRRCLARYEEHKRLVLDGPGMQHVRQALDIHEEILRNSTPKQMMDAMDTMRRIIFKQLEQSGKQSLLLTA